jgi:hypothetical protein
VRVLRVLEPVDPLGAEGGDALDLGRSVGGVATVETDMRDVQRA